jgi:hypothetical protein
MTDNPPVAAARPLPLLLLNSSFLNFFGDGFTKDLPAYYFYLLVQNKPEAHKGVSTTLDEGVFYVAGAPAGDLKRPAAALEKKKKKAARQSEANFQGAKDVMEPLLASYFQTQSDLADRREKTQSDLADRREKIQQSRDAYDGHIKMGTAIDSLVNELSNAEHGSVMYKHLEGRVEECEKDRQQLKAKSGRLSISCGDTRALATILLIVYMVSKD